MRMSILALVAIASLNQVASAQDATLRQPSTSTTDVAPAWLKGYPFEQKEFTFVRIKYKSGNFRGRQDWRTDHPDADDKLATLIRSSTSLQADHTVLELTSSDLQKHKLIYIVEPGLMRLAEAEVVALRTYLQNGGFLVLDDSFGDVQFENIRSELNRVFPNSELTELPISHPIFHCVFEFSEKPQVPSDRLGSKDKLLAMVGPAKYSCITDNKGQVMIVVCHNTDLGDGWAHLGDKTDYGREYSDKVAGPFGINLVFYALTKGQVEPRNR